MRKMNALAVLLALVGTTAAAVETGTTIVGEEESEMGLNLMPWKNEARSDMDLAPALLNEIPTTVDPAGFSRRMENYDAIVGHRRERRRY
jgi:hypothetical protein